MTKTVVIVGRPNVGKSTLFNSVIERKEAITSPNPGLTRDRTYSLFLAMGNRYLLIDTGGIILKSSRPIDEKVNLQVDIAISEADLIIFTVDALAGLLPLDIGIAEKLRKTKKPVIVAANKSDEPRNDFNASEFYKFGFEDVLLISGLHKRNIGGLISLIVEKLPDSDKDQDSESYPTLCIAGRPNVGKSTLINMLVGYDRVIVDEKPGTTRNPAKCYLEIRNKKWELVDLAGLWRKNRGKDVEEVISMIASRKEIERADVCVLLLDLSEPLSFQDSRIAGWILESNVPVIIAGNKADLIKNAKSKIESYRITLERKMPFLKNVPFVMISAKIGSGIKHIYKELERVVASKSKIITQEHLDIFLPKMLAKRPPPKTANIRPVILKIMQSMNSPHIFTLVVRHHRLDKIPQHWKNYVRNSLQKEFGFYGIPLLVKYKRDKIRVKRDKIRIKGRQK